MIDENPVRHQYVHVGVRPRYLPLSGMTGNFWAGDDLKSGCGALTVINQVIAETYAREPNYYESTFCMGCGKHLPVAEFVWDGTDERVGS